MNKYSINNIFFSYLQTQHNENQIGLFYTINNDLCKQLFGHGGLPKSYMKQTKTFTETTLMVRSPALDIINCIKSTDLNKPANRYVLCILFKNMITN